MDHEERKREPIAAESGSMTPEEESVHPEEDEIRAPESRKQKKRASLPRWKRWEKVLAIIGAVCLLLSMVCYARFYYLAHMLDSQREAERWQGDGDLAFKQISCFLPANRLITLEDVSAFRTSAMRALIDASMDIGGDAQLMLDCWSTTARLNIYSAHGRGEVGVIAVGGNFFDFHPLHLLSGDYIRQTDLMEDRILLDEEVAWLLYGGTELQGMEVRIGERIFTIAGVVEREKDSATKRAFLDEMGIYMRYDALLEMDENTGISCYEFVLAEPVEGFAMNVAQEKFPIRGGEIVCNTTRYDLDRLLGFVLKFGSRSTQTTGVLFPYWENAARLTESWSSFYAVYTILLAIFPVGGFIIWVIRLIHRGRRKLEREILPEARDRTEEAIRVQKRKRWERTRGAHERD